MQFESNSLLAVEGEAQPSHRLPAIGGGDDVGTEFRNTVTLAGRDAPCDLQHIQQIRGIRGHYGRQVEQTGGMQVPVMQPQRTIHHRDSHR